MTIDGTLRLPGSKSITHRAYLLAAQSDQPCMVQNPLRAEDPDATLAALHRLGALVHPEARAVTFQPAAFRPTTEPLDLRNAGTGLRLLTGTVARLPFPVTLTGDESLQARPNGILLDALRSLGATVTGDQDGCCPYTVHGPIKAGPVSLPPQISSQFASSLLLSLPFLPADSTVHMESPIASRPYLDITLRVAEHFGIRIHEEDGTFTIPGGQVPRAAGFAVEPDWSTAAFPLVAAAITGGRIHLPGLRRDSPQGDKAILDVLKEFGCSIQWAHEGPTLQAGDLESPGTIDVAATPDMFPALCIAAAYARGTTTFTGGASLRHKECDRIEAMAAGLSAMGIDVQERPDGLIIAGGRPIGASIDAHHDHRIHMAFHVAGLASDGANQVRHPESVAVSYPTFHQDLEAIQVRA